MMERIVILHPQEIIDVGRLPLPTPRRGGQRKLDSGSYKTLEEARKAYERAYVLRTLDAQAGNMTRTAEALGLERSHLYRKMKALGIDPTAPRE